MATTGTGSGTGGSSGSGTPKPVVVKPSTPKFGLEATPYVDDTHVNIRIRTSKDGIPCALNVIIHRDYKEIARTDTDAIGFLEHKMPYTQTDKKQTFTFEIFLKDSTEKASLTVEIPEKAAAKSATTNDPQKIVLIRTHDGAGNFRVFIRVIKDHGVGLPVNVDIIFDGNRRMVKTNNRGIGVFDVPRVINPGEEFPLQAIVSGIEDHARLRISRRRLRPGGPALWTPQWFLGTNNGRAFILMCTAALFWVWAILIGVGQPLFHQNWFRNADGLSKQESLYNQVIAQAYQDDAKIIKDTVIKPTKVPGHWHHFIWKTALILTLIFFIYGPLSLREEIAEEVGIAVERLMNREYAQAGDPWFERIVAWSGAYSVAKNKQATVTTDSSSTVSAPTQAKGDVWKEFPVHLASDAITEILPAIFRAIFR